MRRATGKPIYTWRNRARTLADIREHHTKAISESWTDLPWWGEGVFVRHIALGLFEPISLCGRWVGDVNSAPMPTLIGMACSHCRRVWNSVMDEFNDGPAVIASYATAVLNRVTGGDSTNASTNIESVWPLRINS